MPSHRRVVDTILNRSFPDEPVLGEMATAELDLKEGKSKSRPEHGRTMDQSLSASNQKSYNGSQTGREWLVISVPVRSSTQPFAELHAAILE